MAKGGAKKTNQMIQQTYGDARNFGQNFSNTQGSRGEEAYGYGTGIRDYATDQYKALLEGGGGDGGGGGGGGGFDPYSADLEKIRATGGFNPEQVNALRGYGLPKEWAQTGGWSDPEKTNFRLRTTASVPGFFDAMRRNLGQRTAVSGGYGPGLDAASMALAREQSRAGSAASLESEGSLQESIRSGKKWGSETGAANERSIFGNQMSALQQLQAAQRARAGRRSAAAAEDFSQKMAVLGQLRDLAGESYGQDYDRMGLAGFGAGLQGQLGATGQHMQNNPNTSAWDRITQIAGAGAGAAASLFGGGGFAPKRKASPYDPDAGYAIG